jgi:nickel transport protein
MRKDNLVKATFDCHKLLISLAFSTLLLLMPASVVFAHKVNIFAYVEGDTVYTESYFPDGTKAKDGIVEVYDSQGIKLLEGKTDEKGEFSFNPPKKDDLEIVLIASMGHKNSYILSADELAGIIVTEKPQEPESIESEVKEVMQVDLEQIKRIIDSSLDEKLKPIMKQLTKAQQKEVSFTEVVGGIGYIFGIMGIILYFASKKKKGEKKNASTRN